MERLSEQQRIEILIFVGHGDRKRTQDEVCALFNERYPNRNGISRCTVSRVIKKFRQTGNVKNLPKSGRPITATGGEKALNIMLSVEENPRQSLRKLADDFDICPKSVSNLFKKEKLYPYKVHLSQELSENDFDHRVEFCENMQERCNNDPTFSSNIVFSDEATFYLNGSVHRHNCRYWSRNNPHWMLPLHTQRPQKINVWLGMIGHHFIGPFFIEGNLTSVIYLDLLQTQIVPAIAAIFPGDDLPVADGVWFQQDGAPPHYGVDVRQYLSEVFPGRWIGRRGSIEWPARSPDLTPLDFFMGSFKGLRL